MAVDKIEKQLAELVVEFVDTTTPRNLPANFKVLKTKVQSMPIKPKLTSDNPFVDEVCSKWLLKVIDWYFDYSKPIKEIQVSQLPTLEELSASNPPGFGNKCRKEYEALINKYNK